MIVMKIIIMNFCLLELFEDQESSCQVINTLLTEKAAKKYEFLLLLLLTNRNTSYSVYLVHFFL